MKLYLFELVLLLVMGILVADTFVRSLDHELLRQKFSYTRFAVVLSLLSLIAYRFLMLDDPYGDSVLAIIGKIVAVLAGGAAGWIGFRRASNRRASQAEE